MEQGGQSDGIVAGPVPDATWEVDGESGLREVVDIDQSPENPLLTL